jgi:NADH-quinone oxidoreductase subunit I
MYGKGIVKGLGVTLKRFANTFWVDIKWRATNRSKRYGTEEGIQHRTSKDAEGIFTIQYPEEELPIPEEFRYIPFLIYEEGEEGEIVHRCTSCGICAKVCPPQCIWIERTTDPKTGRPVPEPAEFYIDVDICMNCGLCAEFCPFDAIKMDHDFELAVYERFETNIYDKEKLSRPLSYYANIRPGNYEVEVIAKKEAEKKKAEMKAKKEAMKAEAAAKKAQG